MPVFTTSAVGLFDAATSLVPLVLTLVWPVCCRAQARITPIPGINLLPGIGGIRQVFLTMRRLVRKRVAKATFGLLSVVICRLGIFVTLFLFNR